MAEFKDRFRQLREESKLTQIQLAEKLEISKGTIGNYESGIRMPRFVDLERIADFFNVDIDYLLGRTNYRPEYSLEEEWIIHCYRRADSNTKEGIKTILRNFDEKSASSRAG